MIQRRNSSLLELEAADYFKLDPAQVNLFASSNQIPPSSSISCRSTRQLTSCHRRHTASCPMSDKMLPLNQTQTSRNLVSHNRKLHQTTSQVNPQVVATKRQVAAPEPTHSAASEYPQVLASTNLLVGSSTTSTNSLPSISSSPSVSPSLVCPHLSLDDLLRSRGDSKSPHTIGLCARCRLDPPADVQSPLSPAFRPSLAASRAASRELSVPNRPVMRRGYSDHQSNSHRAAAKAAGSGVGRKLNVRDDSLDYCLEPRELKRLQLSPTLRHSVEFIRRNSIESGRVLTIYKNGQPFDKPLRICVTRNEFQTLNHLLDHINSRQLIPSGARYLFHLDGQLVYSVHELKHGSVYIVSGTRAFDVRTSTVLKEQRQRKQSRVAQNSAAQVDQTISQPVKAKQAPASTVTPISDKKSAATKRPSEKLSEQSTRKTQIVQVRDDSDELKTQRTRSKITTLTRDKVANKPKKLSQSSTDLNEQKDPPKSQQNQEKPATIIRAKSELSAITNKRKKNVTFVDATSEASLAPVDRKDSKAMEAVKSGPTNEIGIQVSDSIDGFLIDLPLALPPRSKDSSAGVQPAPGAGQRIVGAKTGLAKANRKIVTITERQLSLDEMNSLKDLDHGDHHREDHSVPPVTIKFDEASELEPESSEHEPEADADSEVFAPDRTGTITIGVDPGDLAQVVKKAAGDDRGGLVTLEDDDTKWQYPGGRDSNKTPTERPISQSDANESVHARVTTPTPSLSTVGDSTSLSMSYEAAIGSTEYKRKQADLPSKQVVPVVGSLCRGENPPTKNFALQWVNGFTINDQYPENCSILASPSLVAAGTNSGHKSPSSEATLLSPSYNQSGQSNQFKSSERFHNWICHSRRHDELVYPAGCFIVLWCRWTDEQRYYSKHNSSVSALTLAPMDADLAASSQLADASERIHASIHLWSLTTLETLMIIDDGHFRSGRLFSLRVKHYATDGSCELSAASRDERRLWLYVFSVKLNKSANKSPTSPPVTVIKENKILQKNQSPVMIVPTQILRTIETNKATNRDAVDLLLSFGRRHFHLWLADRRQQKLRLLQSESRSTNLVESIVKATSLVRMSPLEFLVGDLDGNITMLVIDFSAGARQSKYTMETVRLVTTKSEAGASFGEPERPASITCLTRVSGTLFATADSKCAIKFWKIDRRSSLTGDQKTSSSKLDRISCRQIGSLSLPRDLGYICTILLAKYHRKPSTVEFYVISTSNAILFGSVKLQLDRPPTSTDRRVLENSSLCVVYEGHETSAMSLVADHPSEEESGQFYFTCSLDSKICKWDGKSLVWKSMLPSACASLVVHPSGFVLAVGSTDGTVYILDKISGLLISYFPLTPVRINCLAYTKDGALLAAGCANGSIFILPVYERGLRYMKVSIFQSPHPVMSLQFSLDNRYMLTAVTNGSYQELILWDLPKFRYMKDNVRLAVDRIDWFDSICSGSEDVRAIWENANLTHSSSEVKQSNRRPSGSGGQQLQLRSSPGTAVNLSCHRLIRSGQRLTGELCKDNFAVASDTRGYLRLFRYPCYDIQQGFYERRVSGSAVNCCRFLAPTSELSFVSSSLDGSICLWRLE